MRRGSFDTKRMVILSLLGAILLVLSWTPLGYLNIGPLAITLNMVPVAIGAVALGPSAGAALGLVFGITSALQCVGIGGTSAMGVILFGIDPVLAVLQRLIPRILAGWIAGWFGRLIRRWKPGLSGYMTGFVAALLNTLLFMTALVLMFSSTEYLQGLMAGKDAISFIIGYVGVNALVEAFATTAIVGAICRALEKTKLIGG